MYRQLKKGNTCYSVGCVWLTNGRCIGSVERCANEKLLVSNLQQLVTWLTPGVGVARWSWATWQWGWPHFETPAPALSGAHPEEENIPCCHYKTLCVHSSKLSHVNKYTECLSVSVNKWMGFPSWGNANIIAISSWTDNTEKPQTPPILP